MNISEYFQNIIHFSSFLKLFMARYSYVADSLSQLKQCMLSVGHIYNMPQLTLAPDPRSWRLWRLAPPSDPVSASEGSLGARLVAESVL